jgi:hypothetical protein
MSSKFCMIATLGVISGALAGGVVNVEALAEATGRVCDVDDVAWA